MTLIVNVNELEELKSKESSLLVEADVVLVVNGKDTTVFKGPFAE